MSLPQALPRPLVSQVGGHPGIVESEDGSLIIKSCLPVEREFYGQIASDVRLAALRPHVPIYYGTLQLQGAIRGGRLVSSDVTATPKDEIFILRATHSIVLENLAHNFKRPNVMDVKLGTVLYSEDADEAKRQRMIVKARETTSLETGIRFVGCQVFDPSQGVTVTTPKEYGRSLKVSELPLSMVKFFPSTSINDKSLMLAVIDGIIDQVQQIKAVLSTIEMRLAGGSILVVWEGDEAALAEGLIDRQRRQNEDRVEQEEEGSEDEDDLPQESEVENKPSDVYDVKLIDFARARLLPGGGPDQGVLFGLETMMKILRGRRAELVAESE
ncbi:hypothetical protein FRB98_005347 [Tulasnella sp. 332]|nr:hypothetical protein FRB98_005347 [Tulasnella sp. 332]